MTLYFRRGVLKCKQKRVYFHTGYLTVVLSAYKNFSNITTQRNKLQ